ncbi:MAG: transposase, partial [Clostridiales bacterium]|nr:transposase [Clostridiales bacterium]
MLLPNNKQRTKLFGCAGVARFAFNWALGYEKENYEKGEKYLTNFELRKVFTNLKRTEEYTWLNNYSNNITKQAIKDSCSALERFFNKQGNFPHFKSKRRSKPSFYVDTDKIQITNTHIKLEKLTHSRKASKQKFNWIKLAEKNRIPIECKYINPRVTFDDINWWISVAIEIPDSTVLPTNDGIGIDIGLKDTAVCSDKIIYKNINKTTKVKKLKKKQLRLQRRISKKYLKNKKGENYCKTSNIIKSENQLIKVNHRLTDIRHNYQHQVTTEILKRKPNFIVLEDLNVVGMMKNKHLAKAIQEQGFYEFYRQIKYKA